MATASLNIIPGDLPSGYCYPSDPQTLNNDILNRASVSLESGSFTVIVTSASAPAITDRDKLWYNTNDNRMYSWGLSAWIHKHPYDINSNVRLWWAGTAVQLQTFDGGDTDPVAPTTGPMWEEDTDFAGRLPLHYGTLPTSGDTIAIQTNGGADQITLASENVPEHTHLGEGFVRINKGNQYSDPSGLTDDGYHEGTAHRHGETSERFDIIGVKTTSIDGTSGQAFDSLNPYRSGMWVKRTSRVYYTAS